MFIQIKYPNVNQINCNWWSFFAICFYTNRIFEKKIIWTKLFLFFKSLSSATVSNEKLFLWNFILIKKMIIFDKNIRIYLQRKFSFFIIFSVLFNIWQRLYRRSFIFIDVILQKNTNQIYLLYKIQWISPNKFIYCLKY